MRILLLLAAFPLLATFAPLALFREPVPPARTALSFEAVPLDKENPARRSVGRLIYLGGWAIRSNDARFGGISAMHVEEGVVTAVSDAGSVISFALPSSSRGTATITPLPQGSEQASKKSDRDSEAMTVHKGRAWIGFEQGGEVWRYRRRDWTSIASARPARMKDWPNNGGSEAMLRLPDGRFLIFSEGRRRRDGGTEALLFEGDPALPETKAAIVAYFAPKDHRITDAALLPGGRMLFLHRGFALTKGFFATLTLTESASVDEGSALSGTEIAHLRLPLTVDNMEALSVTRENGRTIVWIASDDNFNPLQRTLLLKFALAE